MVFKTIIFKEWRWSYCEQRVPGARGARGAGRTSKAAFRAPARPGPGFGPREGRGTGGCARVGGELAAP